MEAFVFHLFKPEEEVKAVYYHLAEPNKDVKTQKHDFPLSDGDLHRTAISQILMSGLLAVGSAKESQGWNNRLRDGLKTWEVSVLSEEPSLRELGRSAMLLLLRAVELRQARGESSLEQRCVPCACAVIWKHECDPLHAIFSMKYERIRRRGNSMKPVYLHRSKLRIIKRQFPHMTFGTLAWLRIWAVEATRPF